jgi:hypothetical protein
MKLLIVSILALAMSGCTIDFEASRQKHIDDDYHRLVERLIEADKDGVSIVVMESMYPGCLTALVDRLAQPDAWELVGGVVKSNQYSYMITLKKIDKKFYAYRKPDGKLDIQEKP